MRGRVGVNFTFPLSLRDKGKRGLWVIEKPFPSQLAQEQRRKGQQEKRGMKGSGLGGPSFPLTTTLRGLSKGRKGWGGGGGEGGGGGGGARGKGGEGRLRGRTMGRS